MSIAPRAFNSREDRRRQLELQEARKAGLVPAEVDEDGNHINPHIPQYLSSAPWYVDDSNTPSLKHQRKRKSDSNNAKLCYNRGQKGFQADKFRKGSCANCGAMTHDVKSCMMRPRKVGAKWTGKYIAPDEIIEEIELDYDGKHDRWNGFDLERYAEVVHRYEAVEEARTRILKEQQSKRVKQTNKTGEGIVSGNTDEAKVEIRVHMGDTPKYLLNLDVDSAYYDPKSRSMREDPLPGADPNEKFYAGDNQNLISGQALEFKQINLLALEAFERGQDVHTQAAPSQAEVLYKNLKIHKEKLKSRMNATIKEKYGNAASEDEIPRELLLGQSDRQDEYDRAGRIIKGKDIAIPKS